MKTPSFFKGLRNTQVSLRLLATGIAFFILASCNSGDQLAGSSSSTETGKISLTGRVMSNNNGPISGVVVTLAKVALFDTTDANGVYHIQRNAIGAKTTAVQSAPATVDTLLFAQNGQIISTLNVTQLIDSFPDVRVVQRNISGGVVSGSIAIGKVEGILSGGGVPAGKPSVAQFFFNKLSNNYSGFIYFPAPVSVQNYSVYVKVFDTAGHTTGQSVPVPFNSLAGDITVPSFNAWNAIPKAYAGNDTTIRRHLTLTLHGAAVDSFGGVMVKWEWDIGNTSMFKATHSSDTTFTVNSTPLNGLPCVLRITDNDGNQARDTIMVRLDSLSPHAPKVMVSPVSGNRRPTWSWSGLPTSQGGIGVFRYKLDNPDMASGATQTNSLSYTPSSDLQSGYHTLYVQEESIDEFWSINGSARVTIYDSSSQSTSISLVVAGNYGSTGILIKTLDAGNSWSSLPVDSTVPLNAALFPKHNVGWAVGGNTPTHLQASGQILKTTDGGNSWTRQIGSLTGWGALDFLDTNTGWVMTTGQGTLNILRTTDGGSTWKQYNTGFLIVSAYTAIQFTNASTGWVAAGGSSIFKTSDGGATWTAKQIGSSILTLHFTSADTGWVGGANGFLAKTTDGGNTWSAESSGAPSYDIISLYFLNSTAGWAIGTNGNGGSVILLTNNGGATWTVAAQPPVGLNSILFVDFNLGWAVGFQGAILKTSDGGATWVPQNSGTKKDLFSIGLMP